MTILGAFGIFVCFNRFALSFRSVKMSNKEFWKVNHDSHFKVCKFGRRDVNVVILYLGAIRIQKPSVAAILRLGAKQMRMGAVS
ncbi:hypothetical protein MtrunA17_Chr3g0106731 [Medicago truncatula]|uniref:Uncharacterized protein n=1 Tax=Medicago truncatula TaxID=3880 RepID=A0A396IXZ1_MEDTR|nr:hypothetical protein MtrunA17_Chr3g0106731 [Medicago truncatula]